VEPVDGFQTDRYLGPWYEIARLDHSFERGLTHVSATYTLRKDGGLQVVNRGFSTREKAWKTAVGKAFSAGKPGLGHLKVSFFGPFYASYVVFALDHDQYRYALVSGPNRSYLWLLSRTPSLDPDLRRQLVEKAKGLGFPTERLIFVDQGEPRP
jgi:apolipoprotein D and lipocalin family protein